MIEDWQKLEAKAAEGLLQEINPEIKPVGFSLETTTIRRCRLPFYKEHILLELTDLSQVPAARKYALYAPGDVNIITWTNQPIYRVNEEAPIRLTEENISAYVKFFFNYVRGRHGRFIVIETIDDIRWQVEPPAQGRKAMQEMLEGVTLVGQDPDGTFHLDAYMVFKDSLFKTKVHVQRDGNVSMSSEELKVEGMPILQDAAV